MNEIKTEADADWPVSWESARQAQLRDMATATPAQLLHWLEQALRLALASGALARAESREQRRRRGLG